MKHINMFAIAYKDRLGKGFSETEPWITNDSENDLMKFASQLRKDTYSDGLRLFKKNSEVGKKWMALASEVKPQRKPRLWMYYHFLMGKMKTRLFRIDGTISCSIENDGQYEKPDEFREIKASEFFKVIEDYEERKNNES